MPRKGVIIWQPAKSPAQYPVAERCDQCPATLSRYNPAKTCSPCQARLWAARAVTILAEGDDVAVGLMPWEMEAQRRVVRRGPLMLDTIGVYGDPAGYSVGQPEAA